jgi:O-acetyl-ADP-ribose deacetylase (regulator of RNase III)
MHVEVVRGDITTQDVEAIVNAANSSLLGGGGVDGAIHSAAGPALKDACRALRGSALPGGLPAGQAVATTAGDLRARHVIHTVGPKHWEHPDGGAALLAQCHLSSLDVADALGVESVAFPAISCGVYGWAAQDAAPIAVGAVRAFGAAHPDTSVTKVRFVLFSDDALSAFEAAVRSAVE